MVRFCANKEVVLSKRRDKQFCNTSVPYE